VIVLEEYHFFDIIIIQLLGGLALLKSKGGPLIVTFYTYTHPRGGVGCECVF
jgi:hypothetical protein